MTYREAIREAIKNSGKSLSFIARKCFMEGVDISPSYISKLQTGKLQPASDRMNAVLAKVLNLDFDELQVLAYKEKVPASVLKKLAGAS